MDVSLLSRRRALALVAVVVAALALAGRFVLSSGTAQTPPPVETVAALEQAEPARLVVHVVGAVRRPGLYRLREGSRVADALARAGGPTRKADVALVNLAAPVADGTQVVVPSRAPPAVATGGAGSAGGNGSSGPVHLNTATAEELDALPGIGPVTAEKIVAYRQEHGAFASVDELDAVPGIGPARLEELRSQVAP